MMSRFLFIALIATTLAGCETSGTARATTAGPQGWGDYSAAQSHRYNPYVADDYASYRYSYVIPSRSAPLDAPCSGRRPAEHRESAATCN